jgi:hypothetical protein
MKLTIIDIYTYMKVTSNFLVIRSHLLQLLKFVCKFKIT